MDEQLPRAVALGLGLLLIASGAAISLLTRRAADGRLPRNAVAGIRTRATLSSDEAWRAGHEAARGAGDASGAAFAVTGLAAAALRDPPLFAGVVLAGSGAGLALALLAARRAGRAVRSGPPAARDHRFEQRQASTV